MKPTGAQIHLIFVYVSKDFNFLHSTLPISVRRARIH